MSALLLTLFVSVVLGTFGVLFFVYTQGSSAADHNDRLSFAPLDDDDALPLTSEKQSSDDGIPSSFSPNSSPKNKELS